MNEERKCALCDDGKDPLYLCPHCERWFRDIEAERMYDEDAIAAHNDLIVWTLQRQGVGDE